MGRTIRKHRVAIRWRVSLGQWLEQFAERRRAFCAARAAQLRVADRNEKRDGAPRFDVGIALHFGNAAYGNVGSGERLDYTVIGRDVNLASRIADLCGRLGECLLLSEPFQSRLSEHELRSLGTFPLKGVDQPQAIFAPAES